MSRQGTRNGLADARRTEQIVAAEASRNIDSVLTFYAEEAVIHPPGAPALRQRLADILAPEH